MTLKQKREQTRKKRKPPMSAFHAIIEFGGTKRDWLKVARGQER